ncbi:hypothetical protein GCM10009636_25570 [Arthrobacter koreensis]
MAASGKRYRQMHPLPRDVPGPADPVGSAGRFLDWKGSCRKPAMEALMSTTPNDENRTHNEEPSEGEETSHADSSRDHAQNAAEGDEGQS